MELLLFALACLGHLAWMVASHNWWYGQAFPKRIGDLFHLAHGVLVAVFPVVLYRLTGGEPTSLFTPHSGWGWHDLLAVYVSLCWLAACVFLPWITLRRLLRREPVAEDHSEILDVAGRLGRKPHGGGSNGRLARLPGNEIFSVEFRELTILHISDLHFNGTPEEEFFRLVIERCNVWQPDLVALTGDIADSIPHQEWIPELLGRLRWRAAAFAILGNHDFWHEPDVIRDYVRKTGMHMLGNSWMRTEVRGEPLVVIGNEYPWERPRPDLAGCPEGPFRLCLSHTPDNLPWAREAGIDLMLSGHVHGGQIRLPGIGSILVPSIHGRRYDAGAFDEPPTLLHVSRGLSGEHPIRYFCRPEATLLRLRQPGP
jgi:predicted MPP superfamily phosphohydrolase